MSYIHTLCAGKHSFHLKVTSPPSVCWLDCPSELKLVAGYLTTVVSSSSNPLIRRLNKSRWFGENLGCWCKFQKKWKGELLSKKKIQDFHQREDPSKGSFLKSGCVWNIHFTSFFSSSFRWPYHTYTTWGSSEALSSLDPLISESPCFKCCRSSRWIIHGWLHCSHNGCESVSAWRKCSSFFTAIDPGGGGWVSPGPIDAEEDSDRGEPGGPKRSGAGCPQTHRLGERLCCCRSDEFPRESSSRPTSPDLFSCG